MKTLLLLVGIIVCAAGILFTGQGLGYINWPASSFMISEISNTGKLHNELAKRPIEPIPSTSDIANAALDRIEIPQDAVERISKSLTPGSSLIISDDGISDETGRDTDFIVLTR
jgi:hypothetical protein